MHNIYEGFFVVKISKYDDSCPSIRVVVPHPCHIRPCLNGGLCVDSFSGYNGYPSTWNHGSLHYLCICRPGFTGLNCESKKTKNAYEIDRIS